MPLDYDKLMRLKFEPVTAAYSWRDVALYALSIGVGAHEPADPQELKYLYEPDLVTLPTFAVTLAASPMLLADPALGVTYSMLLHGEQSLQMHRSLPAEGSVVSQMQIDEIYDKGATKGAVMHLTRRLFDQSSGDLLVTMSSVVFLRGDGGFGGRSDGAPRLRPVPSRAADLRVAVPTVPNQALIYRLCGDYNPLHIDPQAAAHAGFQRPILHGLCAYGMAGRALIRLLCDDEARRLRRLSVRFTSPVFPGERLHLEVWKLDAHDAAFRLVASDRQQVVQDFGAFEYGPVNEQ